jgi:hypothetical protein
MSWAGKQHPVEAALEWLAPIPLALAVGWAGGRLGLSSLEAIACGAAVLIAGLAAIRRVGRSSAVPLHRFEPGEFAPVELDELVLEETDSVLELTDRLEETVPGSRVVRLFEREEPTPGELVDRIVGFLSDGRRNPVIDNPPVATSRIPDASVALHDALANIRASLR